MRRGRAWNPARNATGIMARGPSPADVAGGGNWVHSIGHVQLRGCLLCTIAGANVQAVLKGREQVMASAG